MMKTGRCVLLLCEESTTLCSGSGHGDCLTDIGGGGRSSLCCVVAALTTLTTTIDDDTYCFAYIPTHSVSACHTHGRIILYDLSI